MCFCGSNKEYEDCCKTFCEIFDNKEINADELLLFDWTKNMSYAHQLSFINLTQKYFYRISLYFENILLTFTQQNIEINEKKLNETIFNIQLNINHSILSSTSLMAQGLFLQSGVLHRSAFEDIFVILDFYENRNQFENFIENKYSANKLVSRVKEFIPEEIGIWYGYFTNNFTHFCEIHATPFLPRKCHSDNYIVVLSFQNLMRLLVSYHIVLERIYFDKLQTRKFWNKDNNDKLVIDLDSNPISQWVEKFGKEIVKDFHPHERRENMIYSERTYKFK